ncbi:MAG: hypothetical protein KKH12_16030 [Gammaproteobacteria bacterium]|nr:hypothetical protein [Gammaproteobacteria bacterium]
MSELTLFESRVGQTQGRIQPDGVDPLEGEWAFVLGADQEGVLGEFADGDFAEVTQTVDVTGDTLLRASILLRTPGDVPDGWAWRASLLVDGVEYIAFDGWEGKVRQITDIAVPVADLTGEHDFSVRLTAVEV